MNDKNATVMITNQELHDGQEALNLLKVIQKFLPENIQGLPVEQQLELQKLESDIKRLLK